MHAVSYEELRELSYMGASVLHEESIFPVREARIPIHVRNTNHPEASGTWIVNEGTLMKEHRHGLVAGISGRKGFTMITLTKENLHKQVGFGYGLLKILDRHNISFETMPCGTAETCWLSYEPENVVARCLYREFGFRETGEMDGDEIIAVRSL